MHKRLVEKKSVLACRRLIGRYTCNVLAKEVSKIYWMLQIESKIARTTIYNSSNFVKTFVTFGEETFSYRLFEDDDGEVVQSNETFCNFSKSRRI